MIQQVRVTYFTIHFFMGLMTTTLMKSLKDEIIKIISSSTE